MLHNLEQPGRNGFAHGVLGLACFQISVHQQGSLGKIAGSLLPVFQARKIPELCRRSLRGPVSHVVMGTVSHKGNLEMTASEFKERNIYCLSVRYRHLLMASRVIGRYLQRREALISHEEKQEGQWGVKMVPFLCYPRRTGNE